MAGGPRRAAAAARRCRSGRRADISAPPAASGCRAIRGDSGCADLREDIFHSTDRRDSDFWPAKNRGDSGRAPAKSRPATRCARARGSPERSAGDRVRPRSKISGAAGSNDRRDRSAGEALRPRPRTSGISAPSRILSSFKPNSATRGCGVFRASGSRGGRPRRAAGVGRERGGRAPESAASKDLGSEGCGVTKGGPGSSKKWRRMPTGRASGVTAFNGDSAATPRLTGGSASSFDWRGVLSDGSRAGGRPSGLASAAAVASGPGAPGAAGCRGAGGGPSRGAGRPAASRGGGVEGVPLPTLAR